MTPIGTTVLYTLNAADADTINRHRDDFTRASMGRYTEAAATGYVAHVGNAVRAAEQYPAIVVRRFSDVGGAVNLHVLLDGDDTYWATSRTEGDGEGHWTQLGS